MSTLYHCTACRLNYSDPQGKNCVLANSKQIVKIVCYNCEQLILYGRKYHVKK